MRQVAQHARDDYDTIVIGAGHNALVCAAYLARAGQRIGVFERGDALGGASATGELIPGYQFDLGASTHTFIHLTPIIQDLALDRYGLDYIAIDPLFFMPFPDSTYLALWRSVEQTCESIARFSPLDALIYRRFCREWTPFALTIADLMMTIPSPVALARAVARGLAGRWSWAVQRLPLLRWSIRQFLDNTFHSPQLKAMLGWISAQVGISPDQPGGAIFVIWQLIYHVCGITMPRGGSGMLAQALARAIAAHGGTVHTGAVVRQIIVEQGRAAGIEMASGQRVFARRVVSGTHIKTTAQLLGRQIPVGMDRRIHALKTSNGGGVVLRIAARELPAYLACAEPLAHTAVQLIAPPLDGIAAAWQAFERGVPSRAPLLSITTPSACGAMRDTTLSIWAQYYPYYFAGDTVWDGNMEERVTAAILDTLRPYAPNIHELVVDMRLQTPASFENDLGLIGGDLQHLRVTFDQMMLFRPGLRLSAYRTPIEHLYLTGASTHPGGGITGMPGMNTARAILRDH